MMLTTLVAWRVQPRNYLLFACHLTNTTAQIAQDARFVNYWYLGGREKRQMEGTIGEGAPVKDSKIVEAVQKITTTPAGA